MSEKTAIQNVSTDTFEIGSGYADVGGEDIDLKSLDLTDTLLGSSAAELTQALGEADNNAYEQYHMGDTGISDIELTTFDSALIKDAGIKPYSEDEGAESSMEDSELSEVLQMPKPVKKSSSKEEKKEITPEDAKNKAIKIYQMVSESDKETKELIENDKFAWGIWESPFDETGKIIKINNKETEDNIEFTDEDFESDEDFMNSIDELSNEIVNNPDAYKEIFESAPKIHLTK